MFSHHFPVLTWSEIAYSAQIVATGWTVRGSNPGGSALFSLRSKQALGSTHSLVQWVAGLVPRVERPGRGTDHPLSSSTAVKGLEIYLYSALALSRLLVGEIYILPCSYEGAFHKMKTFHTSITVHNLGFLPVRALTTGLHKFPCCYFLIIYNLLRCKTSV